MAPQDEKPAFPMCAALRCKGMYLNHVKPAGESMEIPGDTTHWWCDLTQYAIGPDQDLVHRTACTPDRSCYRGPIA